MFSRNHSQIWLQFPVWNGSLDSLVINLLLFSVSVLVFSSHLSLEFSFENEVYTAHSGLYTTARTFSFNIAYRMRINNISFNCKQHVQVFIQLANIIDLSFNCLLTISSKHLNLFTGMQCRRNQACGRYFVSIEKWNMEMYWVAVLPKKVTEGWLWYS